MGGETRCIATITTNLGVFKVREPMGKETDWSNGRLVHNNNAQTLCRTHPRIC